MGEGEAGARKEVYLSMSWKIRTGTFGVQEGSDIVRHWELVPEQPSMDPYQVALEIRHLLRTFEDATEQEVENVAARHGYGVRWSEV